MDVSTEAISQDCTEASFVGHCTKASLTFALRRLWFDVALRQLSTFALRRFLFDVSLRRLSEKKNGERRFGSFALVDLIPLDW